MIRDAMRWFARPTVARRVVSPIDAEDEWTRMGSAFRSGTILHASREELERYLFALATVQIRADFNQQRAQQMGETIRLLLARKDSQETNRQAMIVARAALYVSIAALLLTALPTLLSWILKE
jgi:hypothetical protein